MGDVPHKVKGRIVTGHFKIVDGVKTTVAHRGVGVNAAVAVYIVFMVVETFVDAGNGYAPMAVFTLFIS